jgi:Arc/MetJ family transcription regulator
VRVTLDIPAELMQEPQTILGLKSETDVVILALQELIRQTRVGELKKFAGQIDLKIDLKKQRRRPR